MGLPYMPINWGGLGGQCRHMAYMECLGIVQKMTGNKILKLYTPKPTNPRRVSGRASVGVGNYW